MAVSERIKMLFERSRRIAIDPPQSSFKNDIHSSALTIYKDLPRWEKQARAVAFAVVNQQVFVEPDDKIIGRVYYKNEVPVSAYDPDFDFNTQPRRNTEINDPAYAELCRYQLATYGTPGHIAWDWNKVLRRGTEGLRQQCEKGLIRHAGDLEAEHFYKAC